MLFWGTTNVWARSVSTPSPLLLENGRVERLLHQDYTAAIAAIKAANTTPEDYRAAIAVIKGGPPVDNVLV